MAFFDGLVAYWPFNESLADESGNASDLTGTSYSFVPGEFNQAISFNGAGYATVADNAFLSMGNNIEFAIGCYVNFSSLSGEQTIWSKGGETNATLEYRLYWDNFDRVRFEVSNGIAAQGVAGGTIGTPALDTWYKMIAAVHDNGSGIAASDLWQDSGCALSTSLTNIWAQNGTSPFVVGARRRNGGTFDTYLNGAVDTLTVWKKSFVEADCDDFNQEPPGLTGIAFEAYMSRVLSGQLYSAATYGTKTYLLIAAPVTGQTERRIRALVDLNGAQAGDLVNLKVQRDGDDPNDPSNSRCTLVSVGLDYQTTTTVTT